MNPSNVFLIGDLMKEQFGLDDQSVDFSVDPDMYKKLNLKKAKKGEENAYDEDKLYRFQLEKDIEKIKKVKGSCRERNEKFMYFREKMPDYVDMKMRPLASDGNFIEYQKYTIEESWKSTSKPYGVIAHKRYLEYLANLPKGPTEEEIRSKQQRDMDKKLWKDILTGRTELTKKQINELNRRTREEEIMEYLEGMESEQHKKKRIWLTNIKNNNFKALLVLPTKREYEKSMKNHNKGWHFPYNFEKGFPFVRLKRQQDANADVMKDRMEYEHMLEEPTFSAEAYTKGNTGIEDAFNEHIAQLNLQKAEAYLKSRQREILLEKKREQKRKEIEKTTQRRRGQANFDISDDLLKLKASQVTQQHNQYNSLDTEMLRSEIDKKKNARQEDNDSLDEQVEREFLEKEMAKRSERKSSMVQNYSIRKRSIFQAKEQRQSWFDYFFTNRFSSNRPEDSLTPVRERKSSTSVSHSNSNPNLMSLSRKASKLSQVAPSTNERPISDIQQQNTSLSLMERLLESMSSSYRGLFRSRWMREKQQALDKLEDIEEEIGTKDYRDYLMGIPDRQETPHDEYVIDLNTRRKEVQKEMKKFRRTGLFKQPMSEEEKHQFSLLKLRLENIENIFEERKSMANEANERINRMMDIIQTKRDYIQSIEKPYFLRMHDRFDHLFRVKLYNLFKNSQPLVKKKKAKFILPDYTTLQMQSIVSDLIDLRRQEKLIENQSINILLKIIGGEPRTYDNRPANHTIDELIVAARTGNFIDVLDIVSHPVEPIKPNELNQDGYSAMYVALDMVLRNELLEAEESDDMLQVNLFYRTIKRLLSKKKALHTAKLDMVVLILLYYGGDISTVRSESGMDGEAIIHKAAKISAIDSIAWLLKKGCDIHLRTSKFGKTPLMLAVENNQLEATMFLLKNGGMRGLNLTDNLGRTVLHYAAVHASIDIAVILMICGADRFIRSNKGLLPSEEAQTHERMIMSATIITHKSDFLSHKSKIDFLNEQYEQELLKKKKQEAENQAKRQAQRRKAIKRKSTLKKKLPDIKDKRRAALQTHIQFH